MKTKIKTPKKYRHLLGKEVWTKALCRPLRKGFVAGVNPEVGITIKDTDGKDIFCQNLQHIKDGRTIYESNRSEELFDYCVKRIEHSVPLIAKAENRRFAKGDSGFNMSPCAF
jgi:hypothetical protein